MNERSIVTERGRRWAKPVSIALGLALIITLLGGLGVFGPQLPAAQAAVDGTASIGDCVWEDLNVDGLETPGETGINGVIVNLYKDPTNSGVINASNFMSSTTTIAGSSAGATGACATGGYYNFIVDGGEAYIVEIDPSNFAPGGALEDYVHTSEGTIGSNPFPTGVLPLQGAFNDADFGYVLVDARIRITPQTDFNAVNDPHTFDVIVESKVGSGAWTPVSGQAVSVVIRDSDNNVVTPSSNTCTAGTNASGICQVTMNSSTTGVFTANASANVGVTVNLPDGFGGSAPTTINRARDTDPATTTKNGVGGTGPATKTYVDLRISISPLNEDNAVNDPHTFTVLVEQKVGTGAWTPVSGASPSVTISPTPSTPAGSCGTTNASGQCSVTINSNTTGVFTASATVTHSVEGQSITRTTGTAPNQGSGTATKTYVDLRISIGPLNEDNAVNDPHTFTVLVEQKVGNGAWTPVQGASPSVTISPNPSTPAGSCGTTNASGQCSVTINSNTTGVFTASATVTHSVVGQSITRTTGTAPNQGSGTATKTYVDLRISLTPLSDFNAVNDPHTFTVLVEQKIGNGAWTPVQGASPSVTISPTPSTPAGSCGTTNASGQCSVTINSTTTGVFTASATVTHSVAGQSITRTTGTAPNQGSGTATKTYVDLRIKLSPLSDVNAVNDPHTFTVLVEQKVGTGAWTPVQGASPSVTISPNPSTPAGSCGTTNASGECSVTINSSTTGVFTASATVIHSVEGQSITRSTNTALNTAAGGSGNATKTYVDLRISIDPESDINSITDPHTFTILVEQKIGNGAWTPVVGVFPAATVSPTPGSITNNCAATPTNSAGICTVVINSNTEGLFTANASITVSVSGQSITRNTTGDPANIAADGSGPATKEYKAGSIGDFIWWDIDKDGIQDSGEPGIGGVTLHLYNTANCSGNSIATQATNANGGYTFSNLPTGTYCVAVEPNEFVQSGGFGDTLVNWNLSPANVGSNDTIDSDGVSYGTNLVQIRNISIDPVNGPQNDPTNDIGFFKNAGYTVSKTQLTDPTKLGVSVGTVIRFSITIQNTGATHLATIPLEDDYDPLYLGFLDANIGGTNTPPNSTDTTNGLLRWNDLTGSGMLAPGQSIVLEVRFEAVGDTSALAAQSPCTTAGRTCNVATVRDGNGNGPTSDPDGPGGPLPPAEQLPPQSDEDDANILNTTSVGVMGQGASIQSQGVTLRWSVNGEAEVLGFYLHRVLGDGSSLTLNNGQMFDGGQESYSYTDSGMGVGSNADYILEVVNFRGESSIVTLAQVRSIFLPGIAK